MFGSSNAENNLGNDSRSTVLVKIANLKLFYISMNRFGMFVAYIWLKEDKTIVELYNLNNLTISDAGKFMTLKSLEQD